MASPVVEPSFHNIASFSPAFRNHGCSGVINCSVLADKRLRSGTTPVSCLMCAAAQFLKKAIPSHAVYDSKTSVLFLLFTRIVLQSPCKCKFSSPFNCSFQDESPTHCINLFTPKRPNGNLPNMHICASYIYSIKTTLDFSSTLTIYPTYQNDIRGKKRFVKEHAFINLPNHTILNNTRLIFQFHLLHNT